jgi:hypothetical protein
MLRYALVIGPLLISTSSSTKPGIGVVSFNLTSRFG